MAIDQSQHHQNEPCFFPSDFNNDLTGRTQKEVVRSVSMVTKPPVQGGFDVNVRRVDVLFLLTVGVVEASLDTQFLFPCKVPEVI